MTTNELPPRGWELATSIREALDFIRQHSAEITHIDFDYYLSSSMHLHTGARLIRELVGMELYEGIRVFHMPIENYTFHSSDEAMNDQMRSMVATHINGPEPVTEHVRTKTKTSLQRMLGNKGRK